MDFADELHRLGHEVRTFEYRKDNPLYKNRATKAAYQSYILRSLDLRYSRATTAGVKELVAGVPGCQVFFQDASNRQATRATEVA